MNDSEWYNLKNNHVLKNLNSNVNGLADEQVKLRQGKYGLNQLNPKKGKSIWKMLAEQFSDVLVIILIIAAVISGMLGEISDSIVILFVVVLDAVLGIIQEDRAEKSLASLKKLTSPMAVVRRQGKTFKIHSKDLVIGDIINLEAGNLVPADCRIMESFNLKAEESSLTGESVPVEKISEVIDERNIPLGDRKNMLFASSLITYGRCTAVVTETGMHTQIGRIAEMIQEDDDKLTPLQEKLEELGKVLGIAAILICATIFVIGILQKRPYFSMFMTSVSLAVAAIPEGLAAVVTIVLAIGVQRMIKKNVIIRKLPAIETLGSASVICSDKTGTLTQNKMTVMKIFTDNKLLVPKQIVTDKNTGMMFKIMALCNDSSIYKENGIVKSVGDPTETALVEFCDKFEIDKKEYDIKYKRVGEIPFDSERKLMTTINEFDGKYKVLVKGAPDVLLKRCKFILDENGIRPLNDDDVKKIKDANESMARDALRVLAAAYKDLDALPESKDSKALENDLILAGLIGMMDPPREEAKQAVDICKKAGIIPVMITGDHVTTAVAIAKELNILDDRHEAISGEELDGIPDEELASDIEKYRVYARVSPEHKVKIVKAWQSRGYICAMTGDGVNDAPALRKADIGAAMGITGTDVAKEASDMVITDDNFATIVSAVEEGRTIFSNIKKSIHYLLSCNAGEIITLLIATIMGWEEPLIPIHILWINLITDSLPALALGLDPKEKDIMDRKPRKPEEGFFSGGIVTRIIFGGLMIGAVSLFAYSIGLRDNLKTAQTMTFVVLGMSQLAHAYNVRSDKKSLFKIGPFSNKYLVAATTCSVILQLLAVIVPAFRSIFKVASLSLLEWIAAAVLSFMPVIIVEIRKVVTR